MYMNILTKKSPLDAEVNKRNDMSQGEESERQK